MGKIFSFSDIKLYPISNSVGVPNKSTPVPNIDWIIEVKNIRLKGNSFQVPFPIKVSRQISLAIKTLIKSSSGKKKFEDLLVDELINSSLGKSQSIKATNVLHKLASQNKLFSHYRWF